MSQSSHERFSSRAEAYHSYRPGYPPALLNDLSHWLKAGASIAEIGSGTGIFTRLLLERGCEVWAVEPNKAMRNFAEQSLSHLSRFHSVATSAEGTGLADHSIDLLCAAQAFHWFELETCLPEFKRILKPGAPVALIWNYRLPDANHFLQEYEGFLLNLKEYRDNVHRKLSEEAPEGIFKPGHMQKISHPYEQVLDLKGFLGRFFSSSYAAEPDSTLASQQESTLTDLFQRYQHEGKVSLLYQTNCYLGELG